MISILLAENSVHLQRFHDLRPSHHEGERPSGQQGEHKAHADGQGRNTRETGTRRQGARARNQEKSKFGGLKFCNFFVKLLSDSI